MFSRCDGFNAIDLTWMNNFGGIHGLLGWWRHIVYANPVSPVVSHPSAQFQLSSSSVTVNDNL